MFSKRIVAQAIIEKVKKDHNDADIRTSLVEGFEGPEEVEIKNEKGEGFTPDLLLNTGDSAEFYEIELDEEFKLEKWKLFSQYFIKRNGMFNIVTHEDNLPQLRSFLKNNQIIARILFFS